VGHDRGSLVSFRAAMDHLRAVTRLVVMDGLPIVQHLERLNEMFVRTWWHCGFTARPRSPWSGSSTLCCFVPALGSGSRRRDESLERRGTAAPSAVMRPPGPASRIA
jgi:hypothetical protein